MLNYLIVFLYMAIPTILLTSHSLPSGIFYIIVVFLFLLLVQKRFAGAFDQIKRYWPLMLSYSLLFLTVVLSSSAHGAWAGSNGEGALRFFLGLLLCLVALPHVNRDLLRRVIWGLCFAGFASALIIIYLGWNVRDRPDTPGLILTTYSSITLLCSAISLYAVKFPLSRWPKLEAGVKVGAASIAFLGFVAAQTRTGLLGVPLFILLGVLLFVGVKKRYRFVGVLIVSCVLLGAAAFSNDGLRARVSVVLDEAIACQEQNFPTSTCIRFQLWHAALNAGMSNVWIGLGGGDKYNDYLENVAVPNGVASKEVLDIYFGEPHNDVLLMFAAFGLPGALGLLLMYISPCFYFIPRLLKEKDAQVRAIAAMGVALCLGFALFGISETMFRRMNTIGFYTLFVALFIVLSDMPKSQDRQLVRRSNLTD